MLVISVRLKVCLLFLLAYKQNVLHVQKKGKPGFLPAFERKLRKALAQLFKASLA